MRLKGVRLGSAGVAIVATLLAAGCSSAPPSAPETSRDGDRKTADVNEAVAINVIETGVRLKAADDRIAELQRQVGELQNTPEKLELDLLKQRLAALEAKVYARGEGDEAVAAVPAKSPAKSPAKPKPATIPTKKPLSLDLKP